MSFYINESWSYLLIHKYIICRASMKGKLQELSKMEGEVAALAIRQAGAGFVCVTSAGFQRIHSQIL